MKAVNIKKYASFVKVLENGKKDWSDAFQKAIDENEALYIPKGKYFIGKSLIIGSDRKIKAHRKAEICLLFSCKTVLLRNKSVINGGRRAVACDEAHEEKICIEGGIWAEEHQKRVIDGGSGRYDEEHSMKGVSTCMLFNGVKKLTLKNMQFRQTAGFAVQIGRSENVRIENVRFRNCFADGLHLNGFLKNVTVKNISGEVGDDLIALNAYDWENATISQGPMKKIRVEKVRATTAGKYKAIRIQAGVVPTEDKPIDCFIRDLYIKNVKDISVFKLYLQTPAYKDAPDGALVGRLENITIDGAEIVLNEPVDRQPNYMNGDPLTGHFGAFELGSQISRLTLKNIRATIGKTKFPAAHLITVGPKSTYLAERGVELFDPYVVSEVEEILYENVRVNGQKVDNLRDEIWEVEFPNDLYSKQYGAGGSGKVKSVKMIGSAL